MTARLFTSPMFLGFDHLEQMIERASRATSDGYPPYNIEQIGPTELRITLAVAGFTRGDLQITQEDNQLVIRGKQSEEEPGRVLLHRGIASRQFHKAFVLAEGIEIGGAWLDNGLLHIALQRPEPRVTVRPIPIGQGEPRERSGERKSGDAASTADSLPDSLNVGKVGKGSDQQADEMGASKTPQKRIRKGSLHDA